MRDERIENDVKKKSQPDTFPATFAADPIHAIVPIPRAHQWQPVRTGGQRSIDRSTAMIPQGRALLADKWLQELLVFRWSKQGSLHERNHFL